MFQPRSRSTIPTPAPWPPLTRQAAGAEAFAFAPMGEVQVRGRSGKTPVFALGALAPAT